MGKNRVAVTGSGGVLGKELTRQLAECGYRVLPLHHDIEEVRLTLSVQQEAVFALVHCAFPRSEEPYQLAEALHFTEKVMRLADQLHITRVVNISSKSVYEGGREAVWNERTPVAPKSCYALAKYAAERIGAACIRNPDSRLVHLRLASLIGPGMEQRIVTKFVKACITGKDLLVTAGGQLFQYMDLRDAALAVVSLLSAERNTWKPLYCVGPQGQQSLRKIAEAVLETCRLHGCSVASLTVSDTDDLPQNSAMDSSLFSMDTGWFPQHSLEDTVQAILQDVGGRA